MDPDRITDQETPTSQVTPEEVGVGEPRENGGAEVEVRGGNGGGPEVKTNGEPEARTIVVENVGPEIAKIKQELGEEGEPPSVMERRNMLKLIIGVEQVDETKIEQAGLTEKWQLIQEVLDLVTDKYETREKLRLHTKVFDVAVSRLRDIVDQFSPWTLAHSTRLTGEAYKLAKDIWEFSAIFMKNLRDAGLIHDVGKAATPFQILEKPSRMNDAEFERMKKHPDDGRKMAAPVCRRNSKICAGFGHHEKVDGSGYPDGLKGTEIPFIARLLAYTDVLDAVSSERPYKLPFLPEFSQQAVMEPGVGVHFDPYIAAGSRDRYERRGFTFKQYFRPERTERQIENELVNVSPFTQFKNERARQKDVRSIAKIFRPHVSNNGSKRSAEEIIARLDMAELVALKAKLDQEQTVLGDEEGRLQDISVDALMILVKAIDARYSMQTFKDENQTGEAKEQDGQDGESDEERIVGQARTENVIRYAWMLLQHMKNRGYEGAEDIDERQVIMAAMFCDVGVLGVDPKKISYPGFLGVTDMKAIQAMPAIGNALLEPFIKDPEIAPWFNGAEAGATQANLWADGRHGYGITTNGAKEPSLLGKIVAVAYKYTALRSDNPRRDPFDHKAALETMLRGTAKGEFDADVMQYFVEVDALDMLRVYQPRPEVVGDIKEEFKGNEVKVVPGSQLALELASKAGEIYRATSSDEKLKLCMEGAKLCQEHSLYTHMERFLEMEEREFIQRHDLNGIESCYQYDLVQSEAQRWSFVTNMLELIRDPRIPAETAYRNMRKAVGSAEGLMKDFAEMGQVLSDEVANKFRDALIEGNQIVYNLLMQKYRESMLAKDAELALNTFEMLTIVGAELGLSGEGDQRQIEMLQAEVNDKMVIDDIENDIKEAQLAIAEQNPWDAEHYIAVANKKLEDKVTCPQSQEVRDALVENIQAVKKGMCACGCETGLARMRENRDQGLVFSNLELQKKVLEWGGSAEETQEVMEETYARGIEEMEALLQSPELGVEDIPKVLRWVRNIDDWKTTLGLSGLSHDEKALWSRNALQTVRENFDREINKAVATADQAELKRMVLMVGGYIVEGCEFWDRNPKTERLEIVNPAWDMDAAQYLRPVLGEWLQDNFVQGLIGRLKSRLFEATREELYVHLETGNYEIVRDKLEAFLRFSIVDGQEPTEPKRATEVLMRLSQKQARELESIGLESMKRALIQSSDNIRLLVRESSIVTAGQEIENRLESELASWDKAYNDLVAENKGGLTDEEQRIQRWLRDDYVYGVVGSRMAYALDTGEYSILLSSLDKLNDWLERGVITKEKERLLDIREILEPYANNVFEEVARQGDLETFERLLITVERVLGRKIVPSKDEIAALRESCLDEYVNRSLTLIDLYGLKSFLVEMRAQQDRLENYYQLTDEQAQRIQGMADKIILTSVTVMHSIDKLGAATIRAYEDSMNVLREMVSDLQKTRNGLEDATRLSGLLKKYEAI
ncbi:MAG: HD domain-containing protein [Patescibacteria group bacterium]|nr:HD domain-containing protein [Patescibacteria group bacterium]